MPSASLSLAEARRLAVANQGLPGRAGATALSALRRLGYVQIDTISVVERAHHHVLWTRAPRANPGAIETLVRAKKAFEYWWHAAAYLPIEDYRYTLARKRALAGGERHWFDRDKKTMRRVLDRVRAEGALKSSDFEAAARSGPWWDWKPAKRALERLFHDGALMVARREGFQKVYDLPERVLPPGVDGAPPSERELGRFFVLRALGAHGLLNLHELGYLRSAREKRAIRAALPELVEAGTIVETRVESLPGNYWALPAFARLTAPRLALLSPFDNLVIQRKRLKALFGFDYQIECYVPAPKRRYGYFCLPMLWGDRFVGRLDPKADRARGRLLVKSLHWEADAPDEAKDALPDALRAFAAFNGVEYRPR